MFRLELWFLQLGRARGEGACFGGGDVEGLGKAYRRVFTRVVWGYIRVVEGRHHLGLGFGDFRGAVHEFIRQGHQGVLDGRCS